MNKEAIKQLIYQKHPELIPIVEAQETNKINEDKIKTIQDLLAIKEGKPGERGEKGDSGYTPVKGRDYFTDGEIEKLKKEVTPIKGVHYDDGKDGYTPIKGVDYFDGEKGIDGRSIIGEKGDKGDKGDPGKNGKDAAIEIDELVSKVTKEFKSKKLLSSKNIDMSDMRWHGGGLSKVSTDTSLIGNGTPSNPLSVVGGTAFVGSQEKSLTTPNGSTTTFNFTHAVKLINYNGALQIYTGNSSFDDITVSGTSITFLNGVVPIIGDKITNIYQ